MSAITANYEAVAIFSVKNGEEAVQANVEKFKALIESAAELTGMDEWGKRRLAYLINKEGEGYYVLYHFTAESAFPAEFERVAGITDGVLRTMIVKKEAQVPVQVKEQAKEQVKEQAEVN